MNKIILLFLLVAFATLPACKTTKEAVPTIKPVGVQFIESKTLSRVLEIAKEKDLLVFLDIYTDWCLPCKMMDEEVFPDQTLGELMNGNFISYKVNAEKGTGPNIAFLYEVYAYPTLLFINADGKVLEKKVGAAYHSEMMQLANRAISNRNRVQ